MRTYEREKTSSKDAFDQIIINEVALISRQSDENISTSGKDYVINLNKLTNSKSFLVFELPQIADTALSDFKSFEEMERDYILRVLKAKNWRIGGENSAASTLGMHVNTLRGRMKKLGIEKPKPQ